MSEANEVPEASTAAGRAGTPARRTVHPQDLLGDDHIGTSADTPLRPDAFVMSDEEKIAAIEPLFGQVATRPLHHSASLRHASIGRSHA